MFSDLCILCNNFEITDNISSCVNHKWIISKFPSWNKNDNNLTYELSIDKNSTSFSSSSIRLSIFQFTFWTGTNFEIHLFFRDDTSSNTNKHITNYFNIMHLSLYNWRELHFLHSNALKCQYKTTHPRTNRKKYYEWFNNKTILCMWRDDVYVCFKMAHVIYDTPNSTWIKNWFVWRISDKKPL